MKSLDKLVEEMDREGFLVLPGVLSAAEVRQLRAGVEAAFEEPSAEAEIYRMPDMWRPKMFEHGPAFEAIVDHPVLEPLLSRILGDDHHMIANSALRTLPGKGISVWHADDIVRYPRPRGVPLDPRIPIPNVLVNINYYLCDVDEELGPTQFVPGSHRAGRQPESADMDAAGNPVYEGRSMVSATGKAGTAVVWNDQTWHRGATNVSMDRIRWVLQAPFGCRWVAQRFYPFISYQLPEGLLERSSERRKVRLGMHEVGAYG